MRWYSIRVSFSVEKVWKDSESEVFSVKSAYDILRGKEEEENLRWYNFFWRIKALPSIHVTTWRVIENKITTKVNLERRGIVVESNLCFLCGVKEESTSHLCFGCRVSWLVWNLCYAWLGVSLVNLLTVVSHFTQFNLLDVSKFVNLVTGNISIAMVCEIWRHRNNCIFKGGVIDHSKIFSLAQLKVWSWISVKVSLVDFSFSDWCLESLVYMHLIKSYCWFIRVDPWCLWGVIAFVATFCGRLFS